MCLAHQPVNPLRDFLNTFDVNAHISNVTFVVRLPCTSAITKMYPPLNFITSLNPIDIKVPRTSAVLSVFLSIYASPSPDYFSLCMELALQGLLREIFDVPHNLCKGIRRRRARGCPHLPASASESVNTSHVRLPRQSQPLNELRVQHFVHFLLC